ncbi:hypothetical protein LMG31506_05071 [Cupriavidus yeoncheonensis]|uniref:Uncharacterized protein n=2 Tax=Cupriavidus yeoncheonensis TaxID=1462994 RepID=A0A916IZU4_9BURK|nr:hypothetical protein LMG31506_05071 [Cupriavidus yeoncheonensis]
MGMPAKVSRELTEEIKQGIEQNARDYMLKARQYTKDLVKIR